MNRLTLAVIVLAVSAPPVLAQPPCERSPRLVGRCFWVHGRLAAFNGTPTFRIWKIGTRRVLGIDDVEEPHELPQSVKQRLPADAFAVTITGDYRVCPFTRSRPGRMQFVCLAGASRLETNPRP
jgi:hypothetical protein